MLPAAPLRGRLRTNYVPSDDETAALPKLIKAVEPRIASLDAGIEVMKQERDIYSSFVAENCSLISPICYMPPNVLRSIFSATTANTNLHHWRDLVIKTPNYNLWSTIFLKVPVLPPSSAHSMHILPCEMVAAQERLSVDIEAKGVSDALLAPLTNEWCRKMTSLGNLTTVWLSRANSSPLTVFFRDLDVIRPGPQVPDRGYIKKPMDLLLSLLCARSSQWTRLDLRITGWSSSEAAQLQHLFLEGFTGSFKDIPVLWSNLTEFSCTSPSSYTTVLSPSIVLEILRLCPNLVRCELDLSKYKMGLVNNDQKAFVDLPHLERFVVHEYKECRSTSFFGSLTPNFPLLASLSWSRTLDLCFPVQEFGAIRASAAQLVECLKLAVGLTELTINMSKLIPPPPDPLLLDRDSILSWATHRKSLPRSSNFKNLVLARRGLKDHINAPNSHKIDTHAPLTQVLIRFMTPDNRSESSRPRQEVFPKWWDEKQLNSGFNDSIIKVERREAVILHSEMDLDPSCYTEDHGVRRPFEAYWDFDSSSYERSRF
ncbi:hypothetical protein BKA70DRAFT_1531893 [Coprinopsis sp. MPI-PUGE-AT-0042]|nr:hypothetical protein BKA70DRAFT_1531893 [Coprinopsis sp. MPI-PUGE-AT-0042]